MERGKLKIVHVADYVMPSMAYQDFMLAKWNARHGHTVHLVASDRYRPVPDYDNTWGQLLGPRIVGPGSECIEGVTLHRLPCPFELGFRPWLSGLGQKIESVRPDVVFCHGTASFAAFSLPRICRRLEIPLVMDSHMTFGSQRRGLTGKAYYAALRLLTRWVLVENVHGFYGISQECSDFLVQEQGIPVGKVQSLDVGVDTDLFRPDDAAGKIARQELGIPADAKVVLQTGKLTRDKGPHWLTEAMAPLMSEDPNIWLLFVGGAPADYVDDITSPVSRDGVGDRFKIVPPVPSSQLPALFAMADVCVYPNASSLSCMEAAACARPVIVTDLPWGRAREAAGVVLCYQTGNLGDLRRRISSLLSSPTAMKEVGRGARAAVLRSYSYDTIARRSEELMCDAIVDCNGAERFPA